MADVCKLVFALILINFINNVKTDCILSLSKDFGQPSPVFIRNGGYMAPNVKGGAISFQRSETVLVACPGPKRRIVLANVTNSYDVLEAHCIINTTFRVERTILQFKDIRCNIQPYFVTEETKETCAGNSRVYGVGYKVTSAFYPLYSACFNKNQLRTHYVKHRLTPWSFYLQPGVKRPMFVEGTLFGKIRMSGVYKLENQNNRLNDILGANMSGKFISKTQYLTRGHLAARADYTTSAEMRGTFHYVNTAPQWQKGNAGDWAALEEALRRRVRDLRYEVLVYTGTHGVMTLPDRRGQMNNIYLHRDANNNGLVPVPMYYFKLVYDARNKSAAAFVTINSSFYNDTVTDKLQFCTDICAGNKQYSWLSWRSSDGTHSFCCDYQQFVNEIDYLPKIDVKGRFY